LQQDVEVVELTVSETSRPDGGETFDLFTIGHSNHPIERFVGLLQGIGATAVVDVRSQPFSRFCPWFSRKRLREHLLGAGLAYLPMGDALGGRPRDPALFRDGVADYAAMAQTAEFRAGIADVVTAMKRLRLCLMCAERESRSTVTAAC
jgi:uncharacterized protein (DUF488 family)